jgi:hypothetical protein
VEVAIWAGVGGINVLPSLEYIEKEISHAKKMIFPTYVEVCVMAST